MLGVICNAVVEFVRYKKGEPAVKRLSKIHFQEYKNYPEKEFMKLAENASKILEYNDINKFQKHFATFVLKVLIEKYPDFTKRYPNTYMFLGNIDKIHEDLPPILSKKKLTVIERDDDNRVLMLKYVSPNKLDAFFEQLIYEIAKYFQEKVEVKFISKMSEGADSTVAVVKVLHKH